MLEYIPEGQDDCASITVEDGVDIIVWKERNPSSGGKDFVLQWKINQVKEGKDVFQHFQHVLDGPFKAITSDSCCSELKVVKKPIIAKKSK